MMLHGACVESRVLCFCALDDEELAARLGGDSDTMGSILGACCGVGVFPSEAIATVERVNTLNLESICSELLILQANDGPINPSVSSYDRRR